MSCCTLSGPRSDRPQTILRRGMRILRGPARPVQDVEYVKMLGETSSEVLGVLKPLVCCSLRPTTGLPCIYAPMAKCYTKPTWRTHENLTKVVDRRLEGKSMKTCTNQTDHLAKRMTTRAEKELLAQATVQSAAVSLPLKARFTQGP